MSSGAPPQGGGSDLPGTSGAISAGAMSTSQPLLFATPLAVPLVPVVFPLSGVSGPLTAVPLGAQPNASGGIVISPTPGLLPNGIVPPSLPTVGPTPVASVPGAKPLALGGVATPLSIAPQQLQQQLLQQQMILQQQIQQSQQVLQKAAAQRAAAAAGKGAKPATAAAAAAPAGVAQQQAQAQQQQVMPAGSPPQQQQQQAALQPQATPDFTMQPQQQQPLQSQPEPAAAAAAGVPAFSGHQQAAVAATMVDQVSLTGCILRRVQASRLPAWLQISNSATPAVEHLPGCRFAECAAASACCMAANPCETATAVRISPDKSSRGLLFPSPRLGHCKQYFWDTCGLIQ